MQRSLKRILFSAFGTVLLVGGLTACGGHHGGWTGKSADSAQMRERVLERAGKELKLDDAQKQRLATLAAKLGEQRTALMGATDPRADLQALLAGPRFDRGNAQAMLDAKTAAVRGKGPEVIAAAADFFDSLNPEQQQQVREFLAKRRGRGHRG